MLRVFKILLLSLLVAVLALLAYTYISPEGAARLAVAAERGSAHLARREIGIPGFHIVYLEGGQGEPLLLVHGFGADKDNWTRVAKYLTPHYRVVALDLPGFGESSKPQNAGYGIADQVERVHAFVQALGLKNVHLGGSSMGGQIAATYAAKYPGEVQSLWLLAPAGVKSAGRSDLMKTLLAGGKNPLLAQNEDEFAAIFHFVMSDPPYIPRPILNVFAQRRIANYALEQRIFGELIASTPLEDLVGSLQTPTRIVWGDQDRALSVGGAQVLAGLMPKSSVLIMPGVGHLPMIERPRQSADDYLAFRATLQ